MTETTSTPKAHPGQFGRGLSFYSSILKDICQEEKAKITWLSNDYLGIMEKNGRKCRIMWNKYDLNSAVAAAIADDKFATYEVLKAAGVPVIEHALLYELDDPHPFAEGYNSLDYVREYFRAQGGRIVMKPNNGASGVGVSLVTQESDIEPALKVVFWHAVSASMCPFYEVRYEYRLILLDGTVRLAYRKTRGEDWRFNLCHGALAEKLHNVELEKQLAEIARQAAQAIGLRFCSVDISETISGERLVMEVNSHVTAEHYLQQHPEDYALVKEFYHDAVRKSWRA